VLLNNDVEMAGAWVDTLLAPLRRQAATISGVEMRAERAVPPDVLARVGRCEFVAGWCWAFRRDEALEVGGFDESLRLYFSDTDLQARLLKSAGAGSEPAIVSGLLLRHLGHRSTRMLPERRVIWEQDRRRFIQKWTTTSR
jgi:GT2 family glycosyltransferase